MLIDCGTCPGMTEHRCGDCVLTVLATMPALPAPDPWFDADRVGAAGRGRGSARRETPVRPPEWLALDRQEAAAVDVFVRAGLVAADAARDLIARPEARRHRAVG